jgi:diguanylate cyclase (GGDEF)-like protein
LALAKVAVSAVDDATMDTVDAARLSSVERAIGDPTLANGSTADIGADAATTGRAVDQPLSRADCVHQILSAIISHHSVPSTLQMIADAIVALSPSKGVAIFLLSNPQFEMGADAELPKRVPPTVLAISDARTASALKEGGNEGSTTVSGSREFQAGNFPRLMQILDSGVKLCLTSSLVSGCGEIRGVFAVFDHQPELEDDPAQEMIQSLCDLARLAVEHGQLYEEVVHGAQFDRLTGLPNRLLLEDRLRQAMIVSRRQGKLLGVCRIDLDRFKPINDSLGYELGDAFLKLVSERLNQSIREIDTLAREGGDEFILLLRDLAETSDAANICHRLLKDIHAPFLLDGHSLTISASLGVSLFPAHGDTPDLLLRNADMALQTAKSAGGGRAQFYSPALGRQTRRAEEMAGALVSALSLSEFRMVYQPIYTMDKEIVAFEALLRWKHPIWGQISPLEFIPTAERSGLIIAIGDWVIDEVCRQAMKWDAAASYPVKMFANISGVQLERPDFTSKIADALERSGLAPDRLELEITESWVISDLRGAAGKLQKLRDLGIGIAIDDFGTGFASFNYLQELPLDTLKIDRSFVQRLDGSVANHSTVRAITVLAQQLGLKTVAEGVESEQQVRQLGEIGCEYMQGFFLAQPLKPEAAYSLLREQKPSRQIPLAPSGAKAALIG